MISRTLFILIVSIAAAVGMFTGYAYGSERAQIECRNPRSMPERANAVNDFQPDEQRTDLMSKID